MFHDAGSRPGPGRSAGPSVAARRGRVGPSAGPGDDGRTGRGRKGLGGPHRRPDGAAGRIGGEGLGGVGRGVARAGNGRKRDRPEGLGSPRAGMDAWRIRLPCVRSVHSDRGFVVNLTMASLGMARANTSHPADPANSASPPGMATTMASSVSVATGSRLS